MWNNNKNDWEASRIKEEYNSFLKDEEVIKEVKAQIASKYKVKDMGEMDW
jgi:hypothetical protein